MARTNNRLAQIIKTGLKREFSKRTIADVVFGLILCQYVFY
jgi:membrane protease subunit HflC